MQRIHYGDEWIPKSRSFLPLIVGGWGGFKKTLEIGHGFNYLENSI